MRVYCSCCRSFGDSICYVGVHWILQYDRPFVLRCRLQYCRVALNAMFSDMFYYGFPFYLIVLSQRDVVEHLECLLLTKCAVYSDNYDVDIRSSVPVVPQDDQYARIRLRVLRYDDREKVHEKSHLLTDHEWAPTTRFEAVDNGNVHCMGTIDLLLVRKSRRTWSGVGNSSSDDDEHNERIKKMRVACRV